MKATYANAEGTDVALEISGGVFAVKADDPRLGGLTIAAYVPAAPVVPASVRNYQLRGALLARQMGAETLLDAVHARMQVIGGLLQQLWEYGDPISRHGPLVAEITATFGLSPEAVDVIFIEASSIQA